MTGRRSPPVAEALGVGVFIGDADPVAVGELAAEISGHCDYREAARGKRERASFDGVSACVGAMPPDEVDHVLRGGHRRFRPFWNLRERLRTLESKIGGVRAGLGKAFAGARTCVKPQSSAVNGGSHDRLIKLFRWSSN